jgi:hypothetical protein
MEVHERLLQEAGGPGAAPGVGAAWFAARQPGIVAYLETRCGARSDTLAVALGGAMTIHDAYHGSLGTPPPRVQSSLLHRAERAVLDEAAVRGGREDGLSARQPAVARFLAGLVLAPPLPLCEREAARVGMTLAAVAFALDEMATGRAVP